MADLEKEVLNDLTEASEEVLEQIEQIGNKLAGDKVISYSDFKLVEALKDDLIVCASLIALRDHGPLSAGERSLIETAQRVTRKLIEVEKARG